MKKISSLITLVVIFTVSSCSTSKKTTSSESDLQEELNQKNSVSMTLLQRMQQKPGIIVRNGAPLLQKALNSQSGFGNPEPLYVLDGQTMGNSFETINSVVTNIMVKKIEILFGSNAASYGAQAGKGVIKITTFK